MALDKQLIITTAFKVLNEHGYEGLSTRQLAKALGVSGPSLYWHFKTKRDLFNAMAEVMLFKAAAPIANPPADFDYLEWLAQGMRNLRYETLLVRDASMIFVGYQMTEQRASQGPPSSQIILSRIGLELWECEKILRITKRFVTGWTLEEQSHSDETREELDEQFEFALALTLRGVQSVIEEWLAAKRAAKAANAG